MARAKRAAGGGRRGISEALREFAAELPYEREPILDFVIAVASGCPTGSRVLDLGAGDAPYRELFDHAEYVTADWDQSLHHDAQQADIVAPADALPVEDGEFDLVLCTQVLEHVPEPGRVLGESLRVLRPGGSLALTAPLFWELHELPYDFYRYTAAGLRHLAGKAGFVEVEVEPRGDSFSTVAQLLRNLGWAMGWARDGLDDERRRAIAGLEAVADQLAELAPLDVRGLMPLGYSLTARRPELPAG